MYSFKKVNLFDISKQFVVARMLYTCGKNMAQKYDLHHWDNSFIKTLVIVFICMLKNDVYILFEDNVMVATFQTKVINRCLFLEKLCVLPEFSGNGIGSLCLKKVENVANDLKCEKIVLNVYRYSNHAISFYKKNGYRVSDTNISNNCKTIAMEKEMLK